MLAIEKFFIKKFLKGISTETFKIKFWDDTEEIMGDGKVAFAVIFNKPLKKSEVLEDACLAFGEAYMNGDIDFEGDLQFILESIYRNKNSFLHSHKLLSKIIKLKGTSMKKQKEDISYHYDLGNDFYSLWLDETMSYSCGYFKNEDDTLYDAEMNKIHYILKKLNLKEDQTLLDIGCGWGYLIIEAAKLYKVKALGITLSKEQYEEVKRKVKNENLEDYVDVRLMDYRDLEKSKLKFDRIVSVGMLEHVGNSNIPLYFKNIDKVLKDQGIFLLHFITGMFETEGNRWIKKYIFPGGYIPTIRQVTDVFTDLDFHIVDLESLRLHYMKTLMCWEENFENNLDKVRKMFDEKFIRMWRMYLCSCAASFHYGVVDIHQFLLTKGLNNDIPMTRDYLYK
ncbi:methyltransferase domain-containing protein [Clostridium niameyense]|uniref:Methyltransferase domain-containing protein n=1 Tax=Clostridium niameyense TaxID=1622073 RepID=A0A6M0R6G2_9CLOT|nr:cyclopropane-fatty-acyl-phospholipid synthase family protein [Clostridium niameyense]NEZ45776.1 methyltransferase domain-containing protein [Clostridium niameyense]